MKSWIVPFWGVKFTLHDYFPTDYWPPTPTLVFICFHKKSLVSFKSQSFGCSTGRANVEPNLKIREPNLGPYNMHSLNSNLHRTFKSPVCLQPQSYAYFCDAHKPELWSDFFNRLFLWLCFFRSTRFAGAQWGKGHVDIFFSHYRRHQIT